MRSIRRNGDYLLELINDILDLSKIEADKLDLHCQRFDPATVVEDVRSIMDVRAKENGLKLSVEYGKLPVTIPIIFPNRSTLPSWSNWLLS
jgi:two-component system CheB/CheR fusion protein